MAKVTRRKKTAPAVTEGAVMAAASERTPRIPRESTRKGLSYGALQYKDGQDIQRRVFRELKRSIPHWSSLSVAERVRLNISQIKKLNIPKSLMPGVVSQMGVHYFTNNSVTRSAAGQEAISEISSSLGESLSKKAASVVQTGVLGRRAMGKGNVYAKSGKVKERTGKARGEVLRGSQPPRPAGGYGRDRSQGVVTDTSTAKQKHLEAARNMTAGLAGIDEIKAGPKMGGEQAKITPPPAGAVEKKILVQTGTRQLPDSSSATGFIEKPVYKKVAVLFKDGKYYVPSGNGYAAVERKDVGAALQNASAPSEKRANKPLASEGKGRAQTKFLVNQSKAGEKMNRQRLVDIAKRYISDFRAAGKIPSEGGYTALLMDQPHFKDMDSKELRSIIKQARNDIKQGRVARVEKRRGPQEPNPVKRTFSVAGGETTGQKPPKMRRTKKVVSTRSGQKVQVSNEPVGKRAQAIAAAEMAVATERLNASKQIRKDRKAGQIRGKGGKPFKPAKPISRKKAAELEQAWAAGTKNEPVVKRSSARAELKSAAKESGVKVTRLKRGGNKAARINRSKMSMLDQTNLAALERAGSRGEARRLAESLGMSPAVKKIAKSHGLMGVAATFGANYILSLLGEKKKNG